MTKLQNNEGIKKIIMKPSATCFCKIGQDWYVNNFEIIFYPDEYYPDYMEVESWINKYIEGHKFNIEESVEAVYDFLNTYEPAELKVISTVKESKTHFDVVVEK